VLATYFQILPELSLRIVISLVVPGPGCLSGQPGPLEHSIHVRERILYVERLGDVIVDELGSPRWGVVVGF